MLGFNSDAQQVSVGDTVELTGDYRKEYWNEDIKGDKFKTEDGVKYLVITKIKKSSRFYVAAVPVEHAEPVETAESVEPIMTVKKDPYEGLAFTMYQSGQLLEQSGKLKNGAITVQILGIAAGTGIAVFGDNTTSLVTGYTIAGVSSLAGFIMNVIGNSKIKQAGEMLKKEKLRL